MEKPERKASNYALNVHEMCVLFAVSGTSRIRSKAFLLYSRFISTVCGKDLQLNINDEIFFKLDNFSASFFAL
jgi:hypothetical protein